MQVKNSKKRSSLPVSKVRQLEKDPSGLPKSSEQESSSYPSSLDKKLFLLEKVEDLVWRNSGKKLNGLTQKDLMEKCDVENGAEMAAVLAKLGRKVKRTKLNTYFHMSRRISTKRRAELFY